MKRAYILVLLGLGISCFLDFVFPVHHHAIYPWHKMPIFEAFYGFGGCIIIVFVSKAIGKHWLWRTATSVNLPERAFPPGQNKALVSKWYVNEDNPIQKAQILVDLYIGQKTISIASPQSGRVMKRFVDKGDYISPGETILDIRVPKYKVQEQVDDKVIIHE
jgi:hypothetical protein